MQGQLDAMEADQRPWVFIVGAEPRVDLVFQDGEAFTAINFQLKNAGRVPARFAAVVGEFLIRGQSLEDTRKGWDTCDEIRHKPPEQFLAGTAVFPSQEVPQATRFKMGREDVARWTE